MNTSDNAKELERVGMNTKKSRELSKGNYGKKGKKTPIITKNSFLFINSTHHPKILNHG